MLTTLIVFIGLAILVLILFVVLLNQKLSQGRHESSRLEQRLENLQTHMRTSLDGNTQIIQQQVGLLTKQLDDRLGHSTKMAGEAASQVNQRLDNAARVFADLQNKLGKLDEANEKIYNVGKDISSLQEILKRPKARGNLGEFFLADLLAEMLPRERFELQYRFKNNEQVDAAIKVGDHLIPIDSKFPLENFRRMIELADETSRTPFKKLFVSDVKKHIDSIARKYIQPEEGTFDFAFLYIMAENVFYEVITCDDEAGQAESLHAYALKKRIIPVSPSSFYAYLAAMMHALRGERMEKNVIEIVSQIRHLGVELEKFKDDFEKVGFHLGNLKSAYEASDKRLNRYQESLERVEGKEPLKLIS